MIMVFKISSGEEVVGELVSETLTTYVIKNPLYARLGYDQNLDSHFLYFDRAAWLTKDAELTIKKINLVFVPLEARDGVIKGHEAFVKKANASPTAVPEVDMESVAEAIAERVATNPTFH